MLFLIFLSSGLFLGWSLGANDAANIFGSAVGSRMISFIKAAWIASVFVILGAVFQGRGASETLNALGSVNTLAGAFAVSLSSAIIVFLMTRRSLPVSTSQAIVGAIIGWSTFTGNPTDYSVLGKIVSTWISGPLLGMIFAALLFILLRSLLKRARIHVIKLDSYIRFSLIVTGAFGAYSLGANNIANVMGVFVPSAPKVNLDFGLFELDGVQILFLLGGLAISAGIFTYSRKVMEKVGNGLLALTPEAALVVVLSQSLVLFLFSSRSFADFLISLGLPPLPMVPVSSTQLVIGALLGIGLVKGMREVKFSALAGVLTGWVITPILSGALSFLSLLVVQNLFGLEVGNVNEHQQSSVIDYLPAEEMISQFNLIAPALISALLVIISLIIWLMVHQQKLKAKAENELLIKQNEIFHAEKLIKEREIQSIQAFNTSLHTQLELKKKEYNHILFNIKEQREFLEHINKEISALTGTKDLKKRDDKLAELSELIKTRMSLEKEVNEFYKKMEETHRNFSQTLIRKHPDLTKSEIRLAILLRLELPLIEVESLMNISPQTMQNLLYRLRTKLQMPEENNIEKYLQRIKN